MKKRDAKLPTVPSRVFSHLGPLPVRKEKVEGCFGMTELSPRTVTITPGQAPEQEWQTYWHEATHVMLFDAGVRLEAAVEEQICDVIGTYLAAAVRSGFLKVNDK